MPNDPSPESLGYTPADLSWARCAHLKEVARMRAELREMQARDSAFDPNGTVADFRERCEAPLRERIAELAKLMKRIVFEGLTHNGHLIPSDALRSAIVSAKEALDA